MTGVGGTGVVTVGQLITMAAHLEGKGASVLDFMGFAQKFGPVLSYIRIAARPGDVHQVRIEPGRADALIGCDLVVSSSPKASTTYSREHTRAVLNTAEMLTGDFVRHRDASLRADERVAAIDAAVANLASIDANGLAAELLGDTIYANVLLLGCAWQNGLVPVSEAALMRAIELNGVAIETNKKAFRCGRIAVATPSQLQRAATTEDVTSLADTTALHADFLRAYQDEALARRYRRRIDAIRQAAGTSDETLALTVARAYFRLLSYKDEYEVARLHTQTGFVERLRADYGDAAKLRFHMAPPLLGGKTDARGRPLKREFGAWILPMLRLLAKFRRLRGTAFDPFGYTAERRTERALIAEFEGYIDAFVAAPGREGAARLERIAELFLDVRGYGPVKDAAVARLRERLAEKDVRLAA